MQATKAISRIFLVKNLLTIGFHPARASNHNQPVEKYISLATSRKIPFDMAHGVLRVLLGPILTYPNIFPRNSIYFSSIFFFFLIGSKYLQKN